MEEIWTKANIETESYYEVSNLGNIRRLKSNGKYYYKKIQKNRNGNNYVSISTGKKGVNYAYPKNVDKLVLSSFYGGYSKSRDCIHLDGDKSNCRLDNLEWKYGFKKKYDYDLLNSINDSTLDFDNLMIKNYMLTKDITYIYKMLKSIKGLMYLFFKDYGCLVLLDNWIDEELFKVKYLLDVGMLIPGQRHVGNYMKCRAKFHLFRYFDNNERLYNNEYKIEAVEAKKADIYNMGDYDNVEDEIYMMFNQLAG